MPSFIPGLSLSREFLHTTVAPIIDRAYPGLPYSAALIGSGSEVLGYDTEMSTDHHWGPRVMLFLRPDDHARHARALRGLLSHRLPYQFAGWSTHFGSPKIGGGDNGTQIPARIDSGPVNHRVEILTIDGYLRATIGISAEQPLSAADWLSLPQQKLLSLTAGDVFRDDLNLAALRARLAWYPHDVWLYLLACGWSRIGQDEHLAPRAAMVGDELGAALIAGRLVRSVMQLCFLMARRYAPYAKWLGSAFAELPCAKELTPALRGVQVAQNDEDRQEALCGAYESLNRQHNALGLTEAIEPALLPFHSRGFQVSAAWRYCAALIERIGDDQLRTAAAQAPIGSIDQFSDNTDLREAAHLRRKIAALYHR
ncbi:MAG: DUF4037 domain-containing protein [Chloroflexi bacterium]|nr:DUF4037 domain-containing protein [Chloroflexota bacterium]